MQNKILLSLKLFISLFHFLSKGLAYDRNARSLWQYLGFLVRTSILHLTSLKPFLKHASQYEVLNVKRDGGALEFNNDSKVFG